VIEDERNPLTLAFAKAMADRLASPPRGRGKCDRAFSGTRGNFGLILGSEQPIR